jgi:hypothetical protein
MEHGVGWPSEASRLKPCQQRTAKNLRSPVAVNNTRLGLEWQQVAAMATLSEMDCEAGSRPELLFAYT